MHFEGKIGVVNEPFAPPTPRRLDLDRIGRALGVRVVAQFECLGLTGSHKDRESVEILREVERVGATSVGCASTGNAAISLAAYAFVRGVTCHVWIGNSAPSDKLALIEAFGAVLHVVRGTYRAAYERSNFEMERSGIFNANPGVCWCRVEANRAIGHEMAELAPDVMICPVNNGTHLKGVALGLLDRGRVPRMVAATASASRLADSIAARTRLEGELGKLGCAVEEVQVNDEDIACAVRDLMFEGVVAEPSAACSVAALRRLTLDPPELVCLTVTGSGLRYPSAIRDTLEMVRGNGSPRRAHGRG
jgi:threonine synthase